MTFKTSLCLFLLLFTFSLSAQNPKIESIPFDIEICNKPVKCNFYNDNLEITAKGKTNLFNSPSGSPAIYNAPMVLFEPDRDFTLTAKVSGKLSAIYDVAALVVYQDENLWAKLCYENSVKQKPTIVSVVTRTYSDDCNSVEIGDFAYLAVMKKGNEFSFFYSTDEKNWTMVRHFHLNIEKPLKVGFAAHGSRGNGFTGIFSKIKYKGEALTDMRGL